MTTRWEHFKAMFRIDRERPQEHESEPNFLTFSNSPMMPGKLGAVPAAYAAINILATTMAGLPRTVVVGDPPRLATEHPLNALFNYPLPTMDSWQFWEMFYRQGIAAGNTYVYIKRDRFSRPIELIPAICWNTDRFSGSKIRYDLELIDPERTLVTASAYNVLSVHGPGFDGIQSPSPVQLIAKNTLTLMWQVLNHQIRELRAGTEQNNVLTMAAELASELTPLQIKDIQSLVKRKYHDTRQEGIAVLPPGVKPEKLLGGLSSVDMQLVELLKWSVEDVARVWGISPIRLGHYHEGFRVATFEQQAADFERYTIYALAKRFDAQLNQKLLVPVDLRAGYRITTNTDMLRTGSLTERITAAELAVSRGGIWTINEGRELTGQPPRDDGDRLMSPKGAPAQGPNVGGQLD